MIDLYNDTIGFEHTSSGIGDRIKYTHFPENFYRNTNKRLVDVRHDPLYNFNPYVLRDVKPDYVVNLVELCEGTLIKHPKILSPVAKSQADIHCRLLGFKCYLRHPCLYVNDVDIDPNTIVVHTTGVSNSRDNPSLNGHIPDYIIDQIVKTYKLFNIYQVGAKSDRDTPFIDMRGIEFWKMVRLIASSSIFIGIDSGILHIARCFPRINRKVILIQFASEFFKAQRGDGITQPFRYLSLNSFIPNLINPEGEDWYPDWFGQPYIHDSYLWLDHNCQYYNVTDDDIGVTCTYKKL